MSDPRASKEKLGLNSVAPLVIDFAEERQTVSSNNRLRAYAQGQIVFIGHYWMYEDEARALRDWLNQVLP